MKLCVNTANSRNGYNSVDFCAKFKDFLLLSGRNHIELVKNPRCADVILTIDIHMDSPLNSYKSLLATEWYKDCWERHYVYDESDRPNVFGTGLIVSMPKILHDRSKHVPVPYWSTPNDYLFSNLNSCPDRYLMSFRGNTKTHKCRSILKTITFAGYHFEDTTDFDLGDSFQKESYQMDYLATLISSRWSLCPRGYGTSSFRLYESLLLGKHPVVLSDSFVKPAVLGRFPIVILGEKSISLAALSSIALTVPTRFTPLTRCEVSRSFLDSLRIQVPSKRIMSLALCRINSAIWRIVQNLT